MYRPDGAGQIEGFADFPGPALLLGLTLQITTGHIQAERIAENHLRRRLYRHVLASFADSNDQFHFVVQVGCFGWIRHLTCLTVGDGQQRIGRLAEKERIFTAGKAHFLGVFSIIASYTVNTAHWKARVATSNSKRNNLGGGKYICHSSLFNSLGYRRLIKRYGRLVGCLYARHQKKGPVMY